MNNFWLVRKSVLEWLLHFGNNKILYWINSKGVEGGGVAKREANAFEIRVARKNDNLNITSSNTDPGSF